MFRREIPDRFETPNHLLAVAEQLGIDRTELRLLAAHEWRPVLDQVFDRFITSHHKGLSWLWECLREDGVSIQCNNGYAAIAPAFDADLRVWLILEDWSRNKKRGNYWVFDCTWGAALRALGEAICIGEYYFVERRLAWMLLETHHCDIVAVGEPAESFVRGLQAQAATEAFRFPAFSSSRRVEKRRLRDPAGEIRQQLDD